MAGAEIELRTYFSPTCHEQPAFASFQRGPLANTERLSQRALSLPLWEELTREQVATVVTQLACALSHA